MPPLIGISLCLDRGRIKPGRDVQYLDAAYAEALAAAGATPLYLPRQGSVPELLARLDGLLLPGGGDFPPPEPYPEGVVFDAVPEELLAFDRALLAGALERSLPVLGICYGMQLLALAHAGSLHHDLETDRPGAAPHRLPEPEGRHPLHVEAQTRLFEALGRSETEVNSRHHQAVSDPGSLRVAGRAGDGVIEALERDGDVFCVGVQWHPERMPRDHRDRLFGAFAAACAPRQGT